MQHIHYDMAEYKHDCPIEDIHVYMHDSLMICSHNYSCPVCRTEHAVLDLSCGIMQPCWKCQELGYKVIKKTKDKSIIKTFLDWIKRNA